MLLVCIPVVLTHLLTPILPYIYLICVARYMRQIWHFWHFWHKWRIWHATFVLVIYGNMGVKRSVRASGMQIKAIKRLWNMFYKSKFQNTNFLNFPLYFWNFLCIMYEAWGGTSHWSSELIFMFLESVEEGEWENTQS